MSYVPFIEYLFDENKWLKLLKSDYQINFLKLWDPNNFYEIDYINTFYGNDYESIEKNNILITIQKLSSEIIEKKIIQYHILNLKIFNSNLHLFSLFILIIF